MTLNIFFGIFKVHKILVSFIQEIKIQHWWATRMLAICLIPILPGPRLVMFFSMVVPQFHGGLLDILWLPPRIKISVNTDISVIGFYENIGNIGEYFYKNIGY